MITDLSANPYVVGHIVTGPGRFFGRREELDTLESAFLYCAVPPHYSIVGETRSGKSSLISEFLTRNSSSLRAQCFVVHLDMSVDFKKSSTQDFYLELARRTVEAVMNTGASLDAIAPTYREVFERAQWGVVQARLRRFFRQFAQAKARVLFIFDEFDYAPELFLQDRQAFKVLRAVGQESGVAFLVASRREIGVIEADAGISSNLAGIFHFSPIYMPLLAREEAADLCLVPLGSLGRQWSGEVVEDLIRLSGGHPALLQALCHRLFEAAWHLGPNDQRRALDSLSFIVFRQLFGEMAKRLHRYDLYSSLAKLLSDGSASVTPEKTEELVRLRYLNRGDDGRLVPFSPLLRSMVSS